MRRQHKSWPFPPCFWFRCAKIGDVVQMYVCTACSLPATHNTCEATHTHSTSPHLDRSSTHAPVREESPAMPLRASPGAGLVWLRAGSLPKRRRRRPLCRRPKKRIRGRSPSERTNTRRNQRNEGRVVVHAYVLVFWEWIMRTRPSLKW